jgi:hypothetical protein
MAAIEGLSDKDVLKVIRSVCSAEMGSPPDYPFFYMSYREGEHSDEALLRIFSEVKADVGDSVLAILVMCHG